MTGPTGDTLAKELEAAIQDELMAVEEYAKLARKVDRRTLRALILSIIGDEYGHARTFMTIQDLMFGGK